MKRHFLVCDTAAKSSPIIEKEENNKRAGRPYQTNKFGYRLVRFQLLSLPIYFCLGVYYERIELSI